MVDMSAKDATESGSAEGKPRPRRRSALRRTFRRAVILVIILVGLPYAIVPIYASVNPPLGTVMVWRLFAGAPMTRDWVDLDNISPRFVRAVLVSEDARFCGHRGIDWVELQKALGDDTGPRRGASTITMQTVKNLFFWPGRSWIRKGLEAPLALYTDWVLSKRRIMEIYLNIAELDSGIYGAQAAARHYFGVDASKLTAAQSARLAAVLPAPAARDAASPGPVARRVARRIANRAARSGSAADCVFG